jgi:hypothetical protein
MSIFSNRFRGFHEQPIQTHVKVPDKPSDPNFPVHGDLLVYSDEVHGYIPVTPPIAQGSYPLAVDGSLLVWDTTLEVFVVSTTPWLDPAYGDVSVKDAAVAQAVTATPAKLTAFDTDGIAALVTPDHTDDSLVVTEDGAYEVEFTVSYGYAAAAVVQFFIRVDGVESQFGLKQETLNASDVMNASLKGRIDLTAAQAVTIYVEAGADANITVSDATLTIKRIG